MTLEIGSEVGKDDIEVYKSEYLPYTDPKVIKLGSGTANRSIWIDDYLSRYKQIYITATGKTIYGKEADTSFVLSVPYPDKFCEEPTFTFNQKFSVDAIRHGFADSSEIKGYQIAIGEDENLSLRPYGNDVDVSTADWKTGDRIEFPVSIYDLGADSLKSFYIGIRAVNNDGSYNENILDMTVLPAPELSVMADLNIYNNIKVNIVGQIDQEIMDQIKPQNYLYWEFCKNNGRMTSGSTVVPSSGYVEIHKPLPDNMEYGEVYEFKSWYWHTTGQQHVQWRTNVRMPSDALFRTVGIDSNDIIYLNICNVGFNGNLTVSGYKYAIGTSTNPEEYRAFQ